MRDELNIAQNKDDIEVVIQFYVYWNTLYIKLYNDPCKQNLKAIFQNQAIILFIAQGVYVKLYFKDENFCCDFLATWGSKYFYGSESKAQILRFKSIHI